MKNSILFVILLMISGMLSAQDRTGKFKFPINEFSVSINMTTLKDSNTEDRAGFGLGIYRSGNCENRLNFVTGLEFNKTNQFKVQLQEQENSYMMYADYSISCFSVPVGLRVNMGRKTKFFVEPGIYADYLSASWKKGTRVKWATPFAFYDGSNVDENAYLDKLNYGFYFGLGAAIPIGKFQILIKADYKYGLADIHPYQDDPFHNKFDSPIFNRYLRLSIGAKF